MTKKERFSEAFNYLRDKGIVHTQKDVAEKMGSTSPNVSSALKGVESVLTDNFLKRFNEAFGAVFDEQWLLTGTGPMLKDGGGEGEQGGEPSLATLVGEIAAQRRLTEAAQEQVSRSQEQIDRLLTLLEAERGVKPKKSVG